MLSYLQDHWILISLGKKRNNFIFSWPYPWRIHGAGIYANEKGVFVDGIHVTIYSSTMDPMGYMKISRGNLGVHVASVVWISTERLQLSWTFCHGSHPVPGSAPDLLFSRTIMWATVNNNKYINDIVILCHDVIVLFIIKNTQFIIVLFLSLSHYKQTVCNMSRVCWGVRCGDRSDLNVPSCPAAQKKAPEGIQLNPSFLLTD